MNKSFIKPTGKETLILDLLKFQTRILNYQSFVLVLI